MIRKYGFAIVCTGFTLHAIASDISPTIDSGPAYQQIAQLDLQQAISQSITQFEQTSRGDWSYRIMHYENEEGDVSSSTALFDPTEGLSSQWSLLSINGHTPTPKQTLKFIKNKQKDKQSNDQQSFSIKLSDIILVESLRVVYEDSDSLHASFDVYLSRLGEEATKNLQGVLTFTKQQGFIESIKITNSSDFSPMFSAKITDFTLEFQFQKIDNAILPLQNDLFMKGSFAFFTEIDEISTTTYLDYQYVGKPN